MPRNAIASASGSHGVGRALGILAGLIVSATPLGVRAGHDVFHIFSPEVEAGSWGVEALSTFQRGLPRHPDGDGHVGHVPVRAGHEIALHSGVTDFWMAKLALGLAREDGESYTATSLALENVLRLTAAARGPVDLAWFTAVSAGLESGATNAVEFGPIVSFDHGPFAVVLNPFLEKSFGENRESGIAFAYAVRASYEIAERLSVGVEMYGEIENIGNAPPRSEQTHRIGPVLYLGHMHGARRHLHAPEAVHGGHHGHAHAESHGSARGQSAASDWHAEVGVLFGLTQASPDAALKINLGTDF
ncbi:MAG: hypothetical protein ABL908_08880 [Hyphomicrobium sp.]